MVKLVELNIGDTESNYDKIEVIIKHAFKEYLITNKANVSDIKIFMREIESDIDRGKTLRIPGITIILNGTKKVTLDDLDDDETLTVTQVKDILSGKTKDVDEEELANLQEWLLSSLWGVANEATVINILGNDLSDEFLTRFLGDISEVADEYDQEPDILEVASDLSNILAYYKKELNGEVLE